MRTWKVVIVGILAVAPLSAQDPPTRAMCPDGTWVAYGSPCPGARPETPVPPPAPKAPEPPHKTPQQLAFELDEEGVDAYNAKDWATALTLFRQALALLPGDKVIKQNIANTEKQIEGARQRKAKEEAERAMRSDVDGLVSNLDKGLASPADLDFPSVTRGNTKSGNAAELGFNSEGGTPPESLDFKDFQPVAGRKNSSLVNYKFSGNGFVGGTTWILGYNVQKADPRLVAKSQEMLRQQMVLAGLHYASAIDFERYNFVIGIGASTSTFTDLRSRVVFDEFSRGQFSTEHQALYNSLKGRQFDELGCHSNGAMVCLAALENKDIKARRVALYGPQLTRESLKMWQELIRTHQVDAVHVYINENDPVPPFSIAFSDLLRGIPGDAALLSTSIVSRLINGEGSDLVVHTFQCGRGLPTLDCHDMGVYKSNRGCVPHPAGGPVPGTALSGKRGAAEPPPPC